MDLLSSKNNILTPSIHGYSFQDIKEFNITQWSDPLLKKFFATAKIDTQLDKKSYISEILARLIAFFLIIVFSPLFLVVAIGIWITMPGKIFFKQTRVGKDGYLFNVLKFRSMVENAESSTGHTLSWDGDPRVTRFGEFLRKSHLDELPQLINVLKGDMFFIGPRPERPEFTSVYDNEIPGYDKRHSVKPGITGLAQISCVYDATAKDKLKYDLMYIASRHSIVLNLLIAFHTARKMFLMKSTAGVLI